MAKRKVKHNPSDIAYGQYAKQQYAAPSNDSIEIDEDFDLVVSRAEDGSGAWVRAWVWIDADWAKGGK